MRHSSPIVGFWVQRIGVMVMSPDTQMLQPMHSRMSSGRPSSILRGRNGSAMDGRAAPIRSSTPWRTIRTMVSGEVKRPTPTTGFVVQRFTQSMNGCCQPSGAKRELIESMCQAAMFTSHRSGSSASRATMSRDSSSQDTPPGPQNSSVAKRSATAQVSPTASRVSSSTSRSSRTRFSSEPPYSSLRWLRRRCRKCIGSDRSWAAYTYTMSKPARFARNAASRCQRRYSAMSRFVMARAWCVWTLRCGWCEGARGTSRL